MRAIDADKELSCKDCVHCEVCNYWEKEAYPNENTVNCLCKYFSPAITYADLVPHGRWVPLEYDGYADGCPVWDLWECSECQEEHSGDEDTLTPYCPNCGAKMDLT